MNNEEEMPIISIENNEFVPAEMTIPANSEILFKNEDKEEHTVTSDADGFDQVVAPGATTKILFNEPGIYDFHCNYHPDMHGTIVVE